MTEGDRSPSSEGVPRSDRDADDGAGPGAAGGR